MSERPQLAAAILLLLTTACPMMDACSTVVMVPRCDKSWSDEEVVFLGKAMSQLGGEKQLGNGIIELTDYEFHFAPVEIFRGVSKEAKELVVHTGHGMGDCSSEPFLVGVSYLVYARSTDGRLKAWTGTMPEAMAGGALRELRAIARGEHADDLFGTIRIGKPLVNVVVRAVGHAGTRFSPQPIKRRLSWFRENSCCLGKEPLRVFRADQPSVNSKVYTIRANEGMTGDKDRST